MRNKYAGICCDCKASVAAGDGYFERNGSRWSVRCMACVVAGKRQSGKPLSEAQKAYAESRS